MSLRPIADAYIDFMDGLSAIDYLLIYVAIIVSASVFQIGLRFTKAPRLRRLWAAATNLPPIAAVLFPLEYGVRNIDNFVSFIGRTNFLHLRSVYDAIDNLLIPNTNYVLLFGPLLIIAIDSMREKSISSKIGSLVGIWGFITFLYFMNYFLHISVNNWTPSFFVLSMMYMFSIFNQSDIKDRYSLSSVFSGLKFRKAAEGRDRAGFIRLVAVISVMSAFYYEAIISSEVQVAYYAGLLAGLLGIIGFLALIHGFTFDKMRSPKIKRMISADTKNSQGIIAILIGVSIAGMFVAGNPLVFSMEGMSSSNLLQHILFSIGILGGAAAIDSTIRFFHRAVDLVTDADYGADSTVYLFAEMATPQSASAVSTQAYGMSVFCTHIEENGDKVLTIDQANGITIRRMRNTVVVIPRVSKHISVDDASFYRNFVSRGNGLLLMIDQKDAEYKAEILKALGVILQPTPEEFRNQKLVRLDLVNDLEMTAIGGIHPVLVDPVLVGLDTSVHQTEQAVGNLEKASFVFWTVGRGLLVLVGSIDHWNNERIATGDNVLMLDYVQALFRDFFQQQRIELAAQRAAGLPPEKWSSLN